MNIKNININKLKEILKKTFNILFPFLTTTLVYLFFNFINHKIFYTNLFNNLSIIYDLILQIVLAYIFYYFSKTKVLFVVIQIIYFLLIYTGNALKIATLGAPIKPNDIYMVKSLIVSFWNMNPLYIIGGLLPIISIIFLIIKNFKWRKNSVFILCTFLIFIFIPFIFPKLTLKILEEIFPTYSYWDQWGNYTSRGPIFYFAQELEKYKTSKIIPNQSKVSDSLKNLGAVQTNNKLEKISDFSEKPNIYMIIAESFWDPSILKNINFNKEVFDSSFREKWDNGKNSRVISPVFEGRTANAEFEVLCGIPALTDDVIFQVGFKNKLDCLPSLLRELGYSTIAMHPDSPDFYNRINIYKKLGFDKYYSIKDYNKDDMNGMYSLSDESLFNQSKEKINKIKENGKPTFSYFLTMTGHLPYDLNENKRKLILNTEPFMSETLNKNINSIYYTSKEINEYINYIQENDKNSIIIILGDHLPLLGLNMETYKKSGIFNTTEDYLLKYSTPLIFLNNLKSENIGVVSDFELKDIILNKIGYTSNNIFKNINDLKIRPLPFDSNANQLVYNSKDKKTIICNSKKDYPICENTINWEYNMKILYNDILFGKQYSKQNE